MTDTTFEFGENWHAFLDVLNEERIDEAQRSLTGFLGVADLNGCSFLDIGSGSGLFSLAARNLGAAVRSFDVDPQSVGCTQHLKQTYFPDDPDWQVEQASILDQSTVDSLDQYDVVYSWGVLHHTGDMWRALENVAGLVKPRGRLFIALYNDQNWKSKMWWRIKRLYNQSPEMLRPLITLPCLVALWGPRCVIDLCQGKPFATWRNYQGLRGMHPWRDLIDWVGGYPFEVCKPDEVFNFYTERGFTLSALQTVGGSLGCNQFVFTRGEAGRPVA